MKSNKELFIIIIILLIASLLRFYNLMHDSPYFFNPDERNMANAVSGFRLPAKLTGIPICLISQISPILENDPGSNSRRNDPGSSAQKSPINCNLNPHFFSYGQFPLYLAFVSDIFTREGLAVLQGPPLNNYLSTSFPSAIFWLRFWSAFFSTLTVLLVYLITELVINSRLSNFTLQNPTSHIPLLTSLMIAFTPGLIQSAHFGTTESLLTFFFMASIYLSLSYLSHLGNVKFVILTSLVIGLSLGSKLTGIFFFIPPIITLIIRIIEVLKSRSTKKISSLFVYLFICLFVFICSILVFILSSPYNLVEPENFKSAVFGYESDVATGKYEAFYTRQFVNTTPVLFQAEKIFPYALGWPVFVLGTIGFLLFNLNLISKLILFIQHQSQKSKVKSQNYNLKVKSFKLLNFELHFCIFHFAFLIYLIPNAFLFAKWTRFMTPILPFFAVFSGYFIFSLFNLLPTFEVKAQKSKIKMQNLVKSSKFSALNLALIFALCALSLLPGVAFMSIYTREDTRITGSKWIYQNIPNNSYILSETANVVDIPLGLPNYQLPISNYQVISFDFYHMDENKKLFYNLLDHLEKAEYIFIPSRRIFANYTKLPSKYPLVTKYYQLLFSGALGFEKVTEISSFPQLSIINYQLSIPDEQSEETYTVFDHPVVRIYHKTKQLSLSDYLSLFENEN